MKKIKCVFRLKCAVLKREKLFPVGLLMVYYEIIWGVIHQMKQFSRFVYNRLPLAPGKNCGPQTCDFYILF